MRDDRPIFILSCSRSGSTLLRVALNAHPDVAAPPELHLLTLTQRLLWTWRITLDAAPDAEATPADDWEPAIRAARRSVDAIMDAYRERTGAPIWCEKSVTSVNHLDMLDAVFPDARVIVLYRHAADMVASGLAAIADRPDGFDFEPWLAARTSRRQALLTYWVDQTTKLTQAADGPDRAAVRYEDFVRDPEAALAQVADALALRSPEDWADRIYRVPAQQGPGDTSVYARDGVDESSLGRGADLDWAGVSRRAVRRANRLLETLGYGPLESPGTIRELAS